jgi:hypothetical protein
VLPIPRSATSIQPSVARLKWVHGSMSSNEHRELIVDHCRLPRIDFNLDKFQFQQSVRDFSVTAFRFVCDAGGKSLFYEDDE